MAKECKIIHINDGSAKVQQNEDFHFVESYDWTAEYIGRLLNEGWEVKHMVPEVSPAIQCQEGAYNFYKSGWTFFLERELNTSDAETGPGLTEEIVDFDQLDEMFEELFSDFIGTDETSDKQ